MASTPRSQLVDSVHPMFYHIVSRCVRRSFLCGYDKFTGKNYDHRKVWLEERMFHLAQYFAVEVHAYAIMENHFHLAVYYDPQASRSWDDAEIAMRWTEAFPPRVSGVHSQDLDAIQEIRREDIVNDPARLKQMRKTLGSLSAFMKHLKQPIAYRANREDNCTGHFFEGPFYSGALLSERAVLACMVYVDLNPIRAEICKTIEGYEHTSIYQRLQHLENSPEKLEQFMQPLVSGLSTTSRSETQLMSLGDYIDHLRMLSPFSEEHMSDEQKVWFKRVASIRKRQRAYGLNDELHDWAQHRGWRRTGDTLD